MNYIHCLLIQRGLIEVELAKVFSWFSASTLLTCKYLIRYSLNLSTVYWSSPFFMQLVDNASFPIVCVCVCLSVYV